MCMKTIENILHKFIDITTTQLPWAVQTRLIHKIICTSDHFTASPNRHTDRLTFASSRHTASPGDGKAVQEAWSWRQKSLQTPKNEQE